MNPRKKNKTISQPRARRVGTVTIPPNPRAVVKGVLVAGEVIDWHSHEGDEYMLMIRGKATVKLWDGGRKEYGTNEVAHIPAGTKHRFENNGKDNAEVYLIRMRSHE